MTAGTWHFTLVEDGEPGETQELDLDGVQDALAEFFARAETEPRGIGFFVTKAPADQGRVPSRLQKGRVPPALRRRGHLTIVK